MNIIMPDAYYPDEKEIPSHAYCCGFCNNKVASNKGFSIQYSAYELAGYIYICPECSMPSLLISGYQSMFPGCSFGRKIEHLPNEVEALYEEARMCYSNDCYISAVSIARKLLMHIAVEKGAEKNKPFVFYVDYLDEKNYIPEGGKIWVDAIRKIGNEANHEINIIDEPRAKQSLNFLQYLLIIVYELPNSIDKSIIEK